MIIAIDFDGTISETVYPYTGKCGKPKKGAVKGIRELHRAGHEIIIWTCRYSTLDLSNMKRFLRRHGIPYHAINSAAPSQDGMGFNPYPKVFANVYIDDLNLGGLPKWDVITALIKIKS